MNEMITWNELECDSTNGYGMQVHYSFTSFDKSEIDKVKEWCESHIQAGVKLENLTFKKESVDLLDKIKAEIIQVAKEEKVHDEKWALGLKYATKIIDKYKAESEE